MFITLLLMASNCGGNGGGSFSLSGVEDISVEQGDTGSLSITVTKQGGFDAPVTFSLEGAGAGVSGTFNPVTSTSSTRLTLTVEENASVGETTLTVKGTVASTTKTAEFTLTVTELVTSDTTPPVVLSTQALDNTTVELKFSEPIVGGDNKDNFRIEDTLEVSAATVSADAQTVTLTTAPQTRNQSYTVVISNVTDVAGNAFVPGSSPTETSFSGKGVPPTLSGVDSEFVVQNTAAAAASIESSFTVTSDEPIAALTVSASSSNDDLIDSDSLNPSCDTDGNCTLSYSVPRAKADEATITVSVRGSGGETVSQNFEVLVSPRLVETLSDAGIGSLRQMIADAEADDVIGFSSLFDTAQIIDLSSGQLTLGKNLSIDASGKDVTVDANSASRHFEVSPGVKASLTGLRLTNGSPSQLCPGQTNECGGAIFVQSTAELTLRDSTIETSESFFGGGIAVQGSLLMENSVINKNSGFNGGGIYGLNADIRIRDSIIGGADESLANIASSGAGIEVDRSFLELTNTVVQHNQATFSSIFARNGGGIRSSNSILSIESDSLIVDNTADDGAGIFTFTNNSAFTSGFSMVDSSIRNNKAVGRGGGLFVAHSTDTSVDILNSVIANNTSDLDGGGIYASVGEVMLFESTLEDNETFIPELDVGGFENTDGDGAGGIFITSSAEVSIKSSTVRGNKALDAGGGAIFNKGGTLSIESSVLYQNEDKEKGGAILIEGGDVTIFNSTLTQNKSFRGAAIADFTGTSTLTIRNSTIAGNLTDNNFTGGGLDLFTTPVSFYSTIVANNSFQNAKITSTVTSLGQNLESGDEIGFTQPLDFQDTDPLLNALADNGGLTMTMSLKDGSPALDKGACEFGPATDQRGTGFGRIVNDTGIIDAVDGCDIGAFENQE